MISSGPIISGTSYSHNTSKFQLYFQLGLQTILLLFILSKSPSHRLEIYCAGTVQILNKLAISAPQRLPGKDKTSEIHEYMQNRQRGNYNETMKLHCQHDSQ